MTMPISEVDESDCCGNGCTNCILDNKPKVSQRAVLAGKRNIILNYAGFRLISNEPHNGDEQVRLLHFGYAHAEQAHLIGHDDGILDIPAGHHVMLRVKLLDHSTPLLRPYSPYWSDFAGKQFKIIVKLQSHGPMSGYLAKVRPQQVLQFRGPIGNYMHDAQSPKAMYIIAQGVAIAPTLPIVAQVLDNEDDMSRICHLVCAHDLQHVYFRERLLEFAQFWNYRSCLYLPHQQCGCCAAKNAHASDQPCEQLRSCLRYKETARAARLDEQQLASHVPPKNEYTTVVIIAGHASFQRTMQELARNVLNVANENVFLL